MSPTGHLAIGFMAKKFTPKTNVLILLVAAYLIDLLHFFFAITGLDKAGYSPWSHSLLMAMVWSVLAVLITILLTKKYRVSTILGLVVFSHWILDFLVWDNLPLGFNNTTTVGLGFYNMIGFDPSNIQFDFSLITATALETGLLILGLLIYLRVRKKQRIQTELT